MSRSLEEGSVKHTSCLDSRSLEEGSVKHTSCLGRLKKEV